MRLYCCIFFVVIFFNPKFGECAVLDIFPNNSTSEVLDVLGGVSAGDVVRFHAGFYLFSEPFPLKSGVTYLGFGRVFIKGELGGYPVISKLCGLKNIRVKNLIFINYGFVFSSSPCGAISSSISFESSGFFDLENNNLGDSFFMVFSRVDDVVISNSIFIRREGFVGNGVQFWRSSNVIMAGNKFGGGVNDEFGYFRTSINVNGWYFDGVNYSGSSNIFILNNTIKRKLDLLDEDHGIYVLGASYVYVLGNSISGWGDSAKGGCIKVRDGSFYNVLGNLCSDGGIYLYNYSNCPCPVSNFRIDDNIIFFPEGTLGRGIFYWRNDPVSTEKGISINGNVVYNGSIRLYKPIDVDAFNEDGGGVNDNLASEYDIPSGVSHTGNVTW